MPRKAGEKKKEMRETTNRTPAWVYVVSVVSAVALGLGTIAIADYLRPSKRAARQAAKVETLRNELSPVVVEVFDALDSAEPEHELFELVEKYNDEFFSLLRRRIDMVKENRFISLEETNDEHRLITLKLAFATQMFLVEYPHSKHYDVVEIIRGGLLEFSGYDAEEIRQDARKLIRRQRER